MKYLLTGGAGFIGSHLAEDLLSQGAEVCLIDDLSTGSLKNIRHLEGKKGFQYMVNSIFNRSVTADRVEAADYIFHLAASVGVRLIIEDPVKTLKTNIHGTEVLLNLASQKKTPVMIFSSSEVYGKSNETKFSENSDLIIGPTVNNRWSYAASKIIDEFLALAYSKENKLPTIIARLFNTVGPRQIGRYGMVLPRLVQQALTNEPMTVFGDGSQTRTFTHVKDVVRAVVQLAQNPNAVGEIFNIGGKEEVSIMSLAQKVKELLQSSSPIVYIPYDEAYEKGFEDMRRRVPDLQKIERMIGYEPQWSLEQMILDVAEYQKRLL